VEFASDDGHLGPPKAEGHYFHNVLQGDLVQAQQEAPRVAFVDYDDGGHDIIYG
jgi:hypothetical protein